jgi:hypothetical protein
MELVIASACGIVGIALLGSIILIPLQLSFVRQLRDLTDTELESRAFRFEDAYFVSVGMADPEVLIFRNLIETESLGEPRAKWRQLRRAFMRLERKRGHRGHPLLMEYYNGYELVLAELARRSRSQNADSGKAGAPRRRFFFRG